MTEAERNLEFLKLDLEEAGIKIKREDLYRDSIIEEIKEAENNLKPSKKKK